MNIFVKFVLGTIALVVSLVVAFEAYNHLREKDYYTVYQKVDIAKKWEKETLLQRHFGNEKPPKYLIFKDSLYLLIQTTEFLYIMDSDPWTQEKILKQIPEQIRKDYLVSLRKDSWLHNEKENF